MLRTKPNTMNIIGFNATIVLHSSEGYECYGTQFNNYTDESIDRIQTYTTASFISDVIYQDSRNTPCFSYGDISVLAFSFW